MAEEELTIIEDEAAAGVTPELEPERPELSWYAKNKKKLILAGSIGGGLFFILLILLLTSGEEEMLPVQDTSLTEDVEQSLERKKQIPLTDLEKMIKKANLLYDQGHRTEALHLFKEIAMQSESISFYNLGIARMKNEQYESAIDAFKKAIEQQDNICVSAINASVCAIKLQNPKLQKYYIDLAAANVEKEHQAPLYSYYKTLIEFYSNHPLEALSSLEHQTSNYFEDIQNYIRAKMAFSLQDDTQAITYLEKALNDDDISALGMMYARQGNLNLAIKTIDKAIKGGYTPTKNSLAAALIFLKSGHISQAGSIYKSLYEKNPKDYMTIYPIRVYLEPSKYDLKVAQEKYKNLQNYSDETNLQILLHFAPYKIFDATNTVGFIKKGSANIYLDDFDSAKDYLNKGTRTSKVNKVIAEAINDAINQEPRKALKKLVSIVKEYPRHAILQYNLALLYAKLGSLKKSNEHFIKSYHLDAKNYMAGIFAIMTSKIVGQINIKQIQHFKENLLKEIETSEVAFIQAMIAFYEKGYSSVLNWSEEQKLNTPLQHALLLLASRKLQITKTEQKEASQLIELTPNDILSHTLYIHANYRNLPDKEFATTSLQYLKGLKLSLNDLFYGSMITQKLFIDYTFVTGHLFELGKKLEKQLTVESKNIVNIMHALALTDIYLGKFEEAFVLYNTLIDEHKEQGSLTLFNAAVSAVGANHHENAIVLLELANLKNRFNSESRYALGLLYLEAKNYNAASMQFSRINDLKFESEYFNFMIDSISIGKELIQTDNN